MSCSQMEGTWTKAMLVVDGTDEVMPDNNIRVHPLGGGRFEVEFLSSADGRVPLNCTDVGSVSEINFTRIHTGGTTTTRYSGKVVAFEPRGLVVIRGRFSRITTFVDVERLTASIETLIIGDWETEKPT